MTTLALSSRDVADIAADVVVLATASTEDGPVLLDTRLPAAVRRTVLAALPGVGASGRADELIRIPSPDGVKADVLALTGTGARRRGGPDEETLRRAAGSAARQLAGVGHVALALPTRSAAQTVAVAEGALLGAYAYTEYRRRSAAGVKPPPRRLSVLTDTPRAVELRRGVERAQVLAEAVAGTRDLVNCPPRDLYPEEFASRARELARTHGIQVRVLEEAGLRRGGYGGLLGVGQGSSRGPRLVKLSYTPAGSSTHVALVGKGITFDSGGLSIKPATMMETMKLDMAGAAAVLHTVVAAARLKLPVRVTGWLCLAENMPSGTAQRPSDVITIRGGRTVEVLNTDAEGRLVLADGIVAAGEEEPDRIIDVATLTGAQMVALGNRVSAVMGNDDAFRDQVVAAADRSGEQFWAMPLPPELRASMDSPVADIANMGERMGGMLVAGLFLSEFVPKDDAGTPTPWAHLDIAGPAFNGSGPHGYTGKGGTGVAVRTLVSLLESLD